MKAAVKDGRVYKIHVTNEANESKVETMVVRAMNYYVHATDILKDDRLSKSVQASESQYAMSMHVATAECIELLVREWLQDVLDYIYARISEEYGI